jgi:uncharacterized DUF497 family protein
VPNGDGPGGFEFEWDEANLRHLAAHFVSWEEAEEALRRAPLDLERQNRDGEERLLQVGETNAGRILVVVSTFSEARIRVVTAWEAKERLTRYWRSLRRAE